MFKKLALAFLASLVASIALAANSATVSWSSPTQNTDGSAITGSITYNVYQGAHNAETLATTGLTVLTYSPPVAGLVSGTTVCWQITAVVSGVESARSSEVCKSFPFPTPNAPTSVSVV